MEGTGQEPGSAQEFASGLRIARIGLGQAAQHLHRGGEVRNRLFRLSSNFCSRGKSPAMMPTALKLSARNAALQPRVRVCNLHDYGIDAPTFPEALLPAAGNSDPQVSAAPNWSNGFTMRLTLNHMGTKKEEHITVKTLRLEGPWAGPRDRLIDTSNLGDYQLAIEDPATNEVLYSRGFNSEFDPGDSWSSVVYSLRFPAPSKSVAVYIKTRNADNVGFHDIWHTVVDPSDKSIDKTPLGAGDVTVLLNSGPSDEKIDLAIIGDGYMVSDRNKFIADARRAMQYLFSTAPYSEHQRAFNVRAVFVPSGTSGTLDPPSGTYLHSALGMSYGFNGVERAIGTLDDSALREAAAVAPYEFLLVITNSKRYGGAADLQRLSSVAIDSKFARYLVLHELSHQFAGVTDEYYSFAKCNTDTKPEPWPPNITASASREGHKWAALLAPSISLPSAWSKKQFEEYDSSFIDKYFAMRKAGTPDADVDAYIAQAVNHEIEILRAEPLFGQVGLFEGARNEKCGLYRAEADCMSLICATESGIKTIVQLGRPCPRGSCTELTQDSAFLLAKSQLEKNIESALRQPL